eukprot:gene11540-biopygen18406
MIRMESGSSVAFQRLSRDTSFFILSAWLAKTRILYSSPPGTRTRIYTRSVWCGNWGVLKDNNGSDFGDAASFLCSLLYTRGAKARAHARATPNQEWLTRHARASEGPVPLPCSPGLGEQEGGAGVAWAWCGRGGGYRLRLGMSGAGVARAFPVPLPWARAHGPGPETGPGSGPGETALPASGPRPAFVFVPLDSHAGARPHAGVPPPPPPSHSSSRPHPHPPPQRLTHVEVQKNVAGATKGMHHTGCRTSGGHSLRRAKGGVPRGR